MKSFAIPTLTLQQVKVSYGNSNVGMDICLNFCQAIWLEIQYTNYPPRSGLPEVILKVEIHHY